MKPIGLFGKGLIATVYYRMVSDEYTKGIIHVGISPVLCTMKDAIQENMLKNNILRLMIIVCSGVLTPILMNVLPIAGGGVSLIFVLSVPVTIGISFIMLLYFFLRNTYNWSQKAFDITLITFSIISIVISLMMFPYE